MMDKPAKLARNLTLFDVYAMSTGAMFSSGLFLLPGIAAMATGNSVFLAYFLAGFLILPAMYCMAELSTAMPKAHSRAASHTPHPHRLCKSPRPC